VGIGTSTPAATTKLDVVQDQNANTWTRIRNNDTGSSAYAGVVVNANGNSWGMRMGSSAANSNSLQFTQDALGSPVVRLTLDTSGNVGIGTTAPQSKLEVRQSSSGAIVNGLTLSNYLGSGAVGTGVALWLDPNGAGSNARSASIQSAQASSGNFADLRFLVSNSATPAEAMRIDSSGNVGIGKTSPNAKLQVTSSSFPVLKVADAVGGGALALGDEGITANYVGAWRGTANSISGGGFLNIQGNGIAFMSSDSVFGSGSERMRIFSAGYTGFRFSNAPTSNALFIEGLNATSVSTSATAILGIASDWGGLVIVTGNNAGLIFTDLLFMATSGINVVSTVSISGSPAARTYTQTSGLLKLAMGSGTYAVSAVQMRGSL
jgi:hypothetical protein